MEKYIKLYRKRYGCTFCHLVEYIIQLEQVSLRMCLRLAEKLTHCQGEQMHRYGATKRGICSTTERIAQVNIRQKTILCGDGKGNPRSIVPLRLAFLKFRFLNTKKFLFSLPVSLLFRIFATEIE